MPSRWTLVRWLLVVVLVTGCGKKCLPGGHQHTPERDVQIPAITIDGLTLGVRSDAFFEACRNTPHWRGDRCEAELQVTNFQKVRGFAILVTTTDPWAILESQTLPEMRQRIEAAGGAWAECKAARDEKRVSLDCTYIDEGNGLTIEIVPQSWDTTRFEISYFEPDMAPKTIYGLGRCQM